MRYLSCEPQAETLGINALAFANHLEGDQARLVLEKCGTSDIRPDQWLPAQSLLEALNDLAISREFTSSLVTVGVQASQIIPTAVKNPAFTDVLAAWGDFYQSTHRGADVGQILAAGAGEGRCRVTFTDLYPDDFNYGIMYGLAQRFLPPGAAFTIYYDPATKPRDRGGFHGFTIICARWG